MSSRWKMSLSTLVIGAAAFLVGPILWPMSPSVPAPPSSLLPGYMAVSAIEARSNTRCTEVAAQESSGGHW